MTEEVDYYMVLEVSKGANEGDIKRAYKKQALRWHPDKNPSNQTEAERQFKLISEAYEVLSDSQKRAIYDTHGKAGLIRAAGGGSGCSSAGGAGRFPHRSHRFHHHDMGGADFHGGPFFHFRDPEEVFREFFGGMDPFESLFVPFHDHPFSEVLGGGPSSRVHRHHHTRSRHAGGGQSASGGSRGHHPYQQTAAGPGVATSLAAHSVSPFNAMFSLNPFFGSSPFAFSPMAMSFGGGMDTGGYTQTSFTNMGAADGSFRSTTTRYINGKQLTTRKVVVNGVETVEQVENGVLKSKTVNGRPVGLDVQHR